MADVFEDQRKFMRACDQTVDESNDSQFQLYYRLIEEEHNELKTAVTKNDRVEQLDALLDIIVVCCGALHSMGVDAPGAWKEVMRSNFAKIDANTGKVRRREDGKVLKPHNWEPPRLSSFLREPS